MQLPFVFLYRGTVSCMPALFGRDETCVSPFEVQLTTNRCRRGGWYTSKHSGVVETRETFFTIMALKCCNQDVLHIEHFVQRLADNMTADGQVPWKFTESWSGTAVPHYKYRQSPVVDANAQFLILLEWLYDTRSKTVKRLYLHARRAYQWLEQFMKDDMFYEPPESSWATSREHSGYVLTSNVLVCQSIRSMELICMIQRDKTQQKLMEMTHGRFVGKMQNNLYTTREAIPRILAIYWNMVPVNFWKSFNQELKYPIPLLVEGPQPCPTTWESWLYGTNDEHTTLVYPWLGFFWIAILFAKQQSTIARQWWGLYKDFHTNPTLCNVYTPENLVPVHRAFIKGRHAHSLTLAMHMAAASGRSTETQSIDTPPQCPDK